MATTTTTSDISAVAADISSLQARWTAATAEYTAQKTALGAKVDAYVAAHQGAADAHTAEVVAATALKATIIPVVAAAESAIDQFVLTTPWYKKAAAWVEKQKRYLLWLLGVLALYGIYKFF